MGHPVMISAPNRLNAGGGLDMGGLYSRVTMGRASGYLGQVTFRL